MKPETKPGLLAMWGLLVSVPFAAYLCGVGQALMRGHTLVHIGAAQSLRSLVIPIAGMVGAVLITRWQRDRTAGASLLVLASALGLLLTRVHGVIASLPGFDMLGILIYSFVDHLLRLFGTAAILGLVLGPASTSAFRWPVCIGGFLAMSVGVDLLTTSGPRGELDFGLLALAPLGLAVCPPAAWLGLESSPATKWRAAVDEWLNDAFVVMAFGGAVAVVTSCAMWFALGLQLGVFSLLEIPAGLLLALAVEMKLHGKWLAVAGAAALLAAHSIRLPLAYHAGLVMLVRAALRTRHASLAPRATLLCESFVLTLLCLVAMKFALSGPASVFTLFTSSWIAGYTMLEGVLVACLTLPPLRHTFRLGSALGD